MFRLDWRLALLVLVFAPMPALIAMRAAPEQVRRERALLDRWVGIYSRFNEVLSGLLIVRSNTMEEVEKNRFLSKVAEANRLVIRGVATDTGYGATSNLVIAVARLAAIALGAYLAMRGEVTVGTVVAFLGYVGGLFGPVQGLSGIYQTLARASVSLDEIYNILDVQEYLGDSPDAMELTQVRGEVEFEEVHFAYEQSGRPLLDGIDLHVNAGETVAIVGPSGSGKTTLMALLMRFYDPVEGAIRIDGHDLRTLKQSSVRRNIGVVLQDPLLFNDTIRANISYARPEASMAEVEAAARTANAHDDPAPAGRLQLGGRRTRWSAVGGRAPTHHHRTRDPQGPAHPGAGRSDFVTRRRIRSRRAVRHRSADEDAHHLHHRAPVIHRGQRRSHHRAARRAHRGIRPASRTAACEWLLRVARAQAAARDDSQ
jgi:ATP-binding cassette subfamily B protein